MFMVWDIGLFYIEIIVTELPGSCLKMWQLFQRTIPGTFPMAIKSGTLSIPAFKKGDRMTEKAINKLAEQELLSEILQTIKSGDEDARGFAVYEKVPLLRDKQAARGEFIKMLYFGTRLKKSKSGETLEVEEDGPEAWENSIIRSWAASAISVLDSNKDKAARLEVVKALQRETVNTTARYWILAALYKMSTRKDLETVVNETAARYKNAIMDGKNLSYESPDPINDRAAPLALAIQASWGDAEATTCLEVLLGSNSFTPMWSTCRALEMVSVRGLLGILTRVASDVRTWPDIRSRCVYAIGKIESPASIRSLGHILSNDQDALVREAAVDGLVNLGTSRTVKKLIEKTKNGSDGSPYSITSHLLGALMDQNAQIRYIAAKALFDVMLDRAP
ncbi:MAG: HEAT repeat domain-containing protein, partial [Anaerolineae bacterium]|nr:HEAT repeat domain-containing protein [Anaerolineae bacterium]